MGLKFSHISNMSSNNSITVPRINEYVQDENMKRWKVMEVVYNYQETGGLKIDVFTEPLNIKE